MAEWKEELKKQLAGLRLEPTREADLVEELSQYLEDQYRALQASGATPEEAHRSVLEQLSNPGLLAERLRQVEVSVAMEPLVPGGRRTNMASDLWQDLRFGIRMFRKNPGFTAIAVLALALGIGANAAIFSVINAVLLRPLPYAEPERLVELTGFPSSLVPLSAASRLDLRDQTRAFESLAAYNVLGGGVNLTGGIEPERVEATEVTTNFFQTLGVTPAIGRAFLLDEEVAGKNNVAVISHGLWRRRFGGDAKLIGQTVLLNGRNFTIVGIAPPDFQYPGKIDFWLPVATGEDHILSASAVSYSVIGRFRRDVSLSQVRAEIETFNQRLRQKEPGKYEKRRVEVVPLLDLMVRKIRPTLLILLGAVGFVLLIACANVSNLLLARAVTRRKEIAVRTALGAGRSRLIQQMLSESALLSFFGGGLGLLIAFWVMRVLVFLRPAGIPRLEEISLDARVFGFTLLVSLLTGMVFGLAPAIQSSKVDLNSALKDGGGQGHSAFKLRSLWSLFVIAEMALALVLLVGAGLLIKSFWRLQQVEPGFKTEGVLTVALDLPDSKYPDDAQRTAFYQQAIERIRAVPGVQAAGATSQPPFSGSYVLSFPFAIEGRPTNTTDGEPAAVSLTVSPDYFRAMGIPLMQGRYLSDQDRQKTAPVVVISQRLARRYWPNESPLGQRLKVGREPIAREIVGVVGDVKHMNLEREADPEMYVPCWQSSWPLSVLVIRTVGDSLSVITGLKGTVQELDRELPLYDIKTMEQRLAESVAQRRFTLLLLSVFAAVALMLAAIGIYGVMAYAVTQRTREVGIRLALGAQRADVLKMIVGQGMILALTGVAAGLLLAVALTRAIASLLFEVSATDPATFAAIALLLSGIALIACLIPGRRATAVDPMVALRHE